MKTVYLAGPIVGYTYNEANDWRDEVIVRLMKHGVIGVSPLRFETFIQKGEVYENYYDDPRFGTPRAIGSKNEHDVRNCDLVLGYFPPVKPGFRHSWGTMCELAGAYFLNKPTILVTEDEDVWNHPVLDRMAGWKVHTLDDAVDICAGVLSAYEQSH